MNYILSSFIDSPHRAHIANIEPPSLLLSPGKNITVTWPSIFNNFFLNMTVDVSIYMQEYTRRVISSPTWKKIKKLASDTPNTGRVEVMIPSMSIRCKYPRNRYLPSNVCPMAIKISVSEQYSSTLSSVGIWTGVGYLPSAFSSGASIRQNCDAWARDERLIGAASNFQNLPPCPSSQALANFDSDYEREILSSVVGQTQFDKNYMAFFHPNIDACYRQVT